MRLSTLIPVAASVGIFMAGCKKDPEPEPVYPTTPPPTVTQTATPAPVGTVATPVAVTMAPFLAVAISAAATNDTRGMNPEGAPFAAQFQQGQIHEQPLQVEPGKCYTVVGMGGPGVNELDIQLVFQPAPMLPPAPLAQDNQSGPQATLGGGGNCWKNPAPIGGPAKIVLKVPSGSGYAAAQIFKR